MGVLVHPTNQGKLLAPNGLIAFPSMEFYIAESHYSHCETHFFLTLKAYDESRIQIPMAVEAPHSLQRI